MFGNSIFHNSKFNQLQLKHTAKQTLNALPELGFRSQAFWGQEHFFDIFLYTANNDTKASKYHDKTQSKLVLQLGTGDRLHLDSTFLLSNDKKKKKESKQFCCFHNLRPSAAEEL